MYSSRTPCHCGASRSQFHLSCRVDTVFLLLSATNMQPQQGESGHETEMQIRHSIVGPEGRTVTSAWLTERQQE